MKKVISLFLAFILCFSAPAAIAVSASALPDSGNTVSFVVNNKQSGTESGSRLARLSASLMAKITPYLSDISVISGNGTSAAAMSEIMMAKLMTGIQETAANGITGKTAVIDLSADTAAVSDTASEKPVSFAGLSELLKKYVFIKLDSSSELAQTIANDSSIDYHILDDGSGTLYISVNIEENPEIFNYAVFRQVVENLAERQNEELLKDTDGNIDYIMTYEHIAGELAIHMLVFAVTGEILSVTNLKDQRLLSLYKSAAVADLNIDEARLPSEVISAAGSLIMNTFVFNICKIFGLI